jgi:hypothetical protein
MEEKMIDRLHNALSCLEQMSPEAQEEAATYIEALVEALKLALIIQSRTRGEGEDSALSLSGPADVQWQDLLRGWNGLPDTDSSR